MAWARCPGASTSAASPTTMRKFCPPGGTICPANLTRLLFIRPGHTVPVAQPAANTAQLDDTVLTFWRFAPDGQPAPYRMYTDDGVTTDHNRPEHWRIVGQ